jgi:hypothetical protein
VRQLPVVALLACAAFQAAPAGLTGRWTYQEQGESLVLDIVHDAQTGRISGSMTMLGATVPIEGRSRGAASFVIESLGGIPTSATGGSFSARLEGTALMLTIASAGEAPKTVAMTRAGGRSDPARPAASATAPSPAPASRPPAADSGRAGPAEAGDFAGQWENVSDDGTSGEVVELQVTGGTASGTYKSFERGYFTGRITIKSQYRFQGSVRGGALDGSLSDGAGSVAATFTRRGEYLVLRAGQLEGGFARPGRPIAATAVGSAEAEALARAVAGRVYSVSSLAGGRGAFVGGRYRLALCANGRIEYDVSDLAMTPGALPGGGVDMGSAKSRRGEWQVVLLAGAPAVRAKWDGTGTSYSLIRYFVIRPSADGRTVVVDGIELPVTGRC